MHALTLGGIRRRLSAPITLSRLRFGRIRRRKVITDPKLVPNWIAGVPSDRPILCCEAVATKLPGLMAGIPSASAQFEALERVMEHIAASLARLENIPEGRAGAAASVREAAMVADRALERLADTYASIAVRDGANRGWRKQPLARHCKRAALRACQLTYRRLLIACRIYSDITPSLWEPLIRLYNAAEPQGFHDAVLDANNGDSIARQITRVLLIVLADPCAMSRRAFEQTRFYIERYGHLARLLRPQKWTGDNEGWFVAWPADGGVRPLVHRGDLDKEHIELLLDAHPLLARLDSQREGLAKGSSPTRLGLPLTARDADYVALLDTLRERWGSPPLRKQNRKRAQPRADVVFGFDQVRQYMKHVAVRRKAPSQVITPFPTTSWEITDRSELGLGLHHEAPDTLAVEVGELMAMSPREDGTVQIAVARRARYRNGHETDVGVELLAGPGMAARFRPPTRDAKGRIRDTVPIIFLPRVPCLNNGPALLAPLDQIEPGILISLPHRDGIARFEAVGTSERFASCELIRLCTTTDAKTQLHVAEEVPTLPE